MKAPRQVHKRATVLLFSLVIAGTPPAPEPARTRRADRTQEDTSVVAMIRKQVRGLAFDSVLGAADAQPLFSKDGRRYGFAKIEPEVRLYSIAMDSLARGRVVARISSEAAYPPLGLGPGINWWWIDMKGGKWRSIVYSEALHEAVTTVLDSLRSHPDYKGWTQSIARFVVLDTIIAMWIGSDRRCIPSMALPALYNILERASPFSKPRSPGQP